MPGNTTSQTSRSTARYRIPIDNPDELANELRSVVTERFGGNFSAAARTAKLKQPHFAKLCSAKLRSVTKETATALRRLIPAERRAVFDTLLLSDNALYMILRVYRPWIDEASTRLFHDPPYQWLVENGRVEQFGGGGDATFGNRMTMATQILAEWLTDFAGYLAPLDRAIERGGHGLNRKSVSLFRMVEPLLDHHASGLVERGWHELSRTEKQRFINASVRREEILLKRERDGLRATRVVSGRVIVPMGGKR
jgi:hypothetical protein